MGVVYKAEDLELQRKVALKFLPANYASDSEALSRFKREAQAAASLNHPNIITVHEVGTHEGRPFIVMAYIEGDMLTDAISGAGIPLERVIDIAIEMCDGLSCAHDAGVVHRDIKPGNILLGKDGRAKILDFGLAKLGGVSKLTKEDSTLGTVNYMSPEQAERQEVDHRSDIFSSGVVLYEMITGQLPFRGDHAAAVMYSIANEDPQPLRRFNREASDELERIVGKALAKKPSERYQDLKEMLVDLRALRPVTRTGRSPVQHKRKGPKRIAVIAGSAIVVVVALALVIVPRLLRTPPPSVEPLVTDERKMIVVLPFENLGPPEIEYFADGITEEITSRLAALSGLGVISRTSAFQYKAAKKSIKQIGMELGVEYVLEGTVRWDKPREGESRVRVTPQLIRVSDDTHLWSEAYDRVLADIFAVQSDIAERIIEQLGISMLERERETVEATPTENLIAYEAYLRGLSRMNRAGRREERWRKAENLFQQAVDLDSTFALAFAKLATVHGELYFWGFDRTAERLAKARAAAEKSLKLQPDLPEAHFALGGYYYMGFFDYDRALKEYAIAAKGMPNSPNLMAAIGYVWRRKGLFKEAKDYLEKATILDPRLFWFHLQLGLTCKLLRQHDEAERHFDRSLALEPEQVSQYIFKSWNILNWTGDLQKSRSVLESSSLQTDPEIKVALFWQHIYERDYQGALDQLSGLPAMIDFLTFSITPRELLAGYAYQQLGDSERALTSYQSALALMEEMVQARPEDGRAYSTLGLAYAGLGRKDDAIRAGRKGLELNPHDALVFQVLEWHLVQTLLLLGEHDAALDHIEHLLSIPSAISVQFLKITPEIDPLRDHPRFKRILDKYSEGASYQSQDGS
jgi:TolB-like protein/Flp pilus assembly protein TadD/predicted Ser/Thr protein kinase